MIFALQAELSFQRDSTGSEGIRTHCLELLGFYIAVDGVIGGKSDSEAPIDHQTIKNGGDGSPYLGLLRT